MDACSTYVVVATVSFAEILYSLLFYTNGDDLCPALQGDSVGGYTTGNGSLHTGGT